MWKYTEKNEIDGARKLKMVGARHVQESAGDVYLINVYT